MKSNILFNRINILVFGNLAIDGYISTKTQVHATQTPKSYIIYQQAADSFRPYHYYPSREELFESEVKNQGFFYGMSKYDYSKYGYEQIKEKNTMELFSVLGEGIICHKKSEDSVLNKLHECGSEIIVDQNINGTTLLSAAAAKNYSRFICKLFELNADFYASAVNPLFAALQVNTTSTLKSDFEAAKVLIEKNPNCLEEQSFNFTPLTANVTLYNFEAVKFLLEMGANPYEIDDHGKNAYDTALEAITTNKDPSDDEIAPKDIIKLKKIINFLKIKMVIQK